MHMASNPALTLREARTASPSDTPFRYRRAISAAVVVGLVPAFARPSAGEPASPTLSAAGAALAAEGSRRNDALIQEGFNLTSGFTVDPGHPVRLELLLPPSDDGELEVKFFHPAMFRRAIDWDSALVKAIPEVEAANDAASYRVAIGRFTGMEIFHADGRQLQQVGIQPHITVRPTLRGLRAGKDEVLDPPLRYLATGK